MAWRSWNAFLADIDDGLIRQNIEAMVAKTGVPGRPGSPGPSLWDAGFRSVGIDEGWEGCGLGAHGTQHDALGNPTVVRSATPFACDFSPHHHHRAPTPSLGKCLQNTKKFPNMSKLVEFGHSKRVKMGFCKT